VQKSLGRGGQDNSPAKVLRTRSSESSRVNVGGVEIGGPHFVVIAGPCAIEGVDQMEVAASSVRRAGAQLLRGGAYKPRTSPYSFQGMGEAGIRILCEAGRKHGLPVIAEVMEIAQIPLMLEQVDILQVGARNMQNFSLLRALSRVRRPVLLKRGFCATVQEWFLAAEYLLDGGNEQVILCERGIRTFEPEVRNTLDLSAVAYAKLHARLPVIVDPSHATGNRDLVIPMALAAAACGADGLLLEVHPAPDQALCDGAQALTPDRFQVLMDRLSPILAAVGRTLGGRPLPAPAVNPR
jgi:3-deoxy-7-phosphoheptulonate synthase